MSEHQDDRHTLFISVAALYATASFNYLYEISVEAGKNYYFIK
jgi:hypothetical protein